MSLSVRARVAAAILAVVALTALATPAWAHDELIASSPGQGDQLAAAPAEVELTFSAEIMQLGAAVIVADAADEDWVAGDIQIDVDTLTVPLAEGMPDGAYEIRWRVVSADGHPISGLIPFTVGDVDPSTEATPTDSQTTTAQDSAAQDGGIPRAVLIGAIGAASALALFALILFFLRGRDRRARGGSDDEPRQS